MDEEEQHEQWIMDRIKEFVAEYDNALWGPAHIVLEDGNIDLSFIQWCLLLTRVVLAERNMLAINYEKKISIGRIEWYRLDLDDLDRLIDREFYPDHSLEELGATADFLAMLERTYAGDFEPQAWELM